MKGLSSSFKKSLEDRVKGALIEAEANEIASKIESNSRFKKRFYDVITDMSVNITTAVLKSQAKEAILQDELEEFTDLLKSSTKQAIASNEFDSKVRDMIYKKTVELYETPKEKIVRVRRETENMIAKLSSTPEFSGLALITQEMVEDLTLKDVYYNSRAEKIKRLTAVAKKSGIDYAVSRESRDIVTRELWPTRKDYVAFMDGEYEKAKIVISQFGDELVRRSSDTGVLLKSILDSAVNSVRKIYADLGGYSKSDLDRIYGSAVKKKARDRGKK